MLRIEDQELISAFLDGELTRNEKTEAVSLINGNVEAKRYYKSLKTQREMMQALPRVTAPVKLTELLNKRIPVITPAKAGFWKKSRVGIIAAATAAAVLAGVFVWNNYMENSVKGGGIGENGLNIAKNGTDFEKMLLEEQLRKEALAKAVKIPKVQPETFRSLLNGAERITGDLASAVSETTQNTMQLLEDAQLAYEGKLTESSILTSPVTQVSKFKTLEFSLNYLKATRDFELTSFVEQFKDKGVFGIDLKTSDTNVSLQRLIQACQAINLPIYLDEELKQRQAKKLPAPYIVYLENLSEKQVGEILTKLQELDKWKTVDSKETKVSSILINPLLVEGRKSLAQALGLGLIKVDPAGSKTAPNKVDPRKPLSNDTLQSLKNATNKPINDGKPFGISVVFHASMPAQNIGKELGQALQSLSGPKSDAITLAFIIR